MCGRDSSVTSPPEPKNEGFRSRYVRRFPVVAIVLVLITMVGAQQRWTASDGFLVVAIDFGIVVVSGLLVAAAVNLLVAAWPSRRSSRPVPPLVEAEEPRQSRNPSLSSPDVPRRSAAWGSGRAIIVVGLAASVGLVATDRLIAHQEMDRLLAATEGSEVAMVSFMSEIGSASVPRTASGEVDGPAALAMVSTLCAQGASDVQVEGAAVADVSMMPWHGSLIRAKDVYLEHSQAWDDQLSSCASSAEAYLDQSYQARISATFRVAAKAYLDALPWPQTSEQRARVEGIFEDVLAS